MAVITADGVVGKILQAYSSTSQVLLINDQSSGVGAILDKSRLQGVVEGNLRRRSDPGECDDRRSGDARRTGGHQRWRPDISQGPYRGYGNESFAGRRSVSQHPADAERQSEPAGRSPGHYQEGRPRAGGGRERQPGAGGGYFDPAPAFGSQTSQPSTTSDGEAAKPASGARRRRQLQSRRNHVARGRFRTAAIRRLGSSEAK